jgi:hypothetical protein
MTANLGQSLPTPRPFSLTVQSGGPIDTRPIELAPLVREPLLTSPTPFDLGAQGRIERVSEFQRALPYQSDAHSGIWDNFVAYYGRAGRLTYFVPARAARSRALK